MKISRLSSLTHYLGHKISTKHCCVFCFVWKIQFKNSFPITFSFNLGKSRGVKEEEKYRENCVRRNTFLNISNQLQRKDGWRLLVMQLKERMGRRDSEHPDKGHIPLREFQKYDSTFSTYLTGTIKNITTK